METSEIKFRLATQADNDGILRLMHSIVMPGDIELIYMKSPDFFKAVTTQGKTQQVLVACREDGKIVATGVRALRRATATALESFNFSFALLMTCLGVIVILGLLLVLL